MLEASCPHIVAFSAATVLCEANLLTSDNLTIVPATVFKGLEAVPFNFLVHYPHDPVLLMAYGAYVR